MTLEIKMRDSDARVNEYYLRKRFGGKKAKLKQLVRLLIATAVAEEAKKELDETLASQKGK